MGGADLSEEGIGGDFEEDQYHPVTVKKGKKIPFFRIYGFDKVNKKGWHGSGWDCCQQKVPEAQEEGSWGPSV